MNPKLLLGAAAMKEREKSASETVVSKAVDENPIFTEKEAAELLKVSVPTLRRERLEGKITHFRVRGCVRYRLSHLQEYEKRQTVPGVKKREEKNSLRRYVARSLETTRKGPFRGEEWEEAIKIVRRIAQNNRRR